MMKLFDGAQKAIEMLHKAGYEAYVVGGAPRDFLMGKEISDFDVATNSRPEQTREIFKEFRLILDGFEMGTVKVLILGEVIEITTFRSENGYSDHRRPDLVKYVDDIMLDLGRRDFTINAMAYNPVTKIIIDPFGGREDIKNGIIRTTGNSEKRLTEDYLRIIRAIRFMCKYDYRLDEETEHSIKKNSHHLVDLKAERLQDEINKMLVTRNPHNAFQKMHELGILPVIMPELDRCFNEGKCLEELGTHSFMVLKNVRSYTTQIPTLLAALFYNIGGHERYREIDSEVSCLRERMAITRVVLERLRYSNHVINSTMILLKNYTVDFNEDKYNRRIELKLLMREIQDDIRELIILNACYGLMVDLTQNLDKDIKQQLEVVEDIKKSREPYLLKHLAVSGYDLLDKGYKGREVGERLEFLLDLVIRNPLMNKKEMLLEGL